MKTKTKTIAILEIAIVLCSMFLVAPVIAAGQTTQKTITTASEDDFTLGIYGNANEDDTIDMRDTTYIKLAIFGKKPKTDLADANYDGKVSMLDVGQVKLIIFGKQKKLTVEDDFGEAVTFRFPIERFVYHGHNVYVYDTLRALDVAERIVGITDRYVNPLSNRYSEKYFPELIGLTNVGLLNSPDYELINELKPDAVITDEKRYLDKEKMPGIPVIALDVKMKQFIGNTRKYGYVFDKREEAEEYINWFNGWKNLLKERTEGLSGNEKPLVFSSSGYTVGKTDFSVPSKDHYASVMVRMAGGRNMGDEISGSSSLKVDAEWIIERNPDIMVLSPRNSDRISGYDIDDPSDVIALRNDILNRLDFAKVKAVEEEKVYMINSAYLKIGGASGLIGTVYMAKWFHPKLFNDIDPQEMHQEFVTRFQHVDFDVREHGVFIYPPQ